MSEHEARLSEIASRWAPRGCSCGDPRCVEPPPIPAAAPEDIAWLLARVEALTAERDAAEGDHALLRALRSMHEIVGDHLAVRSDESLVDAARRVVAERDGWIAVAGDTAKQARLAFEERDAARAEVERLRAENESLRRDVMR